MRRRTFIDTIHVLVIWLALGSPALAQARDEKSAAPAPSARAERPASAPAPAAEADASPQQRVDPQMMEWILKKWERQSSLLKTLDVKLFRIDDIPAWGDKEYFEGRAQFQAPNLAIIDFNKVKQDDGKRPLKDAKGNYVSVPFERIVCTGQEVWQYRSDSQQIFIFPLEKDDQKKALEEGPLPFLFNMRADDAKRRYKMTLMTIDSKSKTYGIRIEPRLTEDKESFSVAFVNLDQTYLLPTRIIMLSPDGKSKKSFQLTESHPNKAVNARNFEGKPLGPPWKMVRNPDGGQRPRAGVLQGNGGAPAGPAAAGPHVGGARR